MPKSAIRLSLLAAALIAGVPGFTAPVVAQKSGGLLKSGHVICNADKTKCYVCPTAEVTPACQLTRGTPRGPGGPIPVPIGAERCDVTPQTEGFSRYSLKPAVPVLRLSPLPPRDAQINGANRFRIWLPNASIQYVFAWRPGGVPLIPVRMPDKPKLVRTTHYQLCAYEDAKAAKCDAPHTIRFRIGDVRYEDGIGLKTLPCGTRGFRASWPNYASLTGITRVFWKVQACNGAKCSAWTQPYPALWAPEPKRLMPQNGTSARFPFGFTWEPVDGAESYRLCIGNGGICREAPGVDVGTGNRVFRVSVPSGASAGRNPGHSVGNDGNYQGQTTKWKAATCVQITGRQDRACVYNLSGWDVTFQ